MKSGLVVLVSLATMVFSGGVVDALNASDYTDPATCGGCHNEIYEQWKGSMHANAHVNPCIRSCI